MQGKKYNPGDMNTSTNSRSALTYSKNDSYVTTPSRYNIGISTGSVGASSRSSKMSHVPSYRPDGYLRKTASTTTTSPSAHFDYVPSYHRNNAETNLDDNDSDSDSDASVQRQRDSMSLASSHSSDEEEATGQNMWKTTPKKVNLPDTVPQTIITPIHSTPKVKPSPDTHKKIWSGDILTSDNETKHRAELKILDPKFPPPDGEKDGSQNSGSVSGSRTHLPAVSQRPDILPLKGIMKTPGSSHKGSPPASVSSHGSLTKIPAGVMSQEKLTIVHPSNQRDNDSDGGSSNETSV